MRNIVFTFCIAAVAFTLLFTGLVFHFWAQMALTVSGLCLMVLFISPGTIQNLRPSVKDALQAPVLGLLSAALLYGIFFAGGKIAAYLFSSAGSLINNVYSLKAGVSHGMVAILLVLVIGLGEEIFWRGFFQKQLEDKYGFTGVILAAGAYTLVHLPSGNPMLIVAAAVCGGFWGFMFYFFRSIWANMISHALWDVAIFILWPVYC